ncbi:MAG: hypothetical protein QXR85_00375 [Candidatus Micrarchaeaceae archaeon]
MLSESEDFTLVIKKMKRYAGAGQLSDIENTLLSLDDSKNIKLALAYDVLDLCKLSKPGNIEMLDAIIKLAKAFSSRPRVLHEIIGVAADTYKMHKVEKTAEHFDKDIISAFNAVIASANEICSIDGDSAAVEKAVVIILNSGMKSLVRG